jgi:DNA-binding protein HU-beta
MPKMSKSQVVAAMAEKSGMAKKDADMFLENLAALATSEVKKEGEFVLPGFGKLVKMDRKERMGRNPATGEPVKIAAKTVVKFRLAKAMKDAVL